MSNHGTAISNTCAAITGTSGVLTFMNVYGGAIGLSITFLMAIVTIYFHVRNLKVKESELAKKQRKEIRDELLEAFREEFKKNKMDCDL